MKIAIAAIFLVCVSYTFAQEGRFLFDVNTSVTEENDFTIYHNYDMFGNDIDHIVNMNYQDCKQSCLKRSDCTHFTLTKILFIDNCFLKGGNSKIKQAKNGYTSGVKKVHTVPVEYYEY